MKNKNNSIPKAAPRETEGVKTLLGNPKKAIIKLAETAAKEPWDIQLPDTGKYSAKVREIAEADLKEAFSTREKQKRNELVDAAKEKVFSEISLPEGDASEQVLLAGTFKDLKSEIVRGTSSRPGSALTAAI